MSTENQKQLAAVALKHRLYSHPNWNLRYTLDEIRDGVIGRCAIKLEYVDGKPVGVAVKDNNLLMVFVRKAYRGRGIGSKLVKYYKSDNVYGSKNSPSNGKIFEYNGIESF